tara:strand:+ start:661 stop:1563 length:903 start_codon:yes stop_codon:yes gene_type:complete
MIIKRKKNLNETHLIIGGDGLIGKSIYNQLKKENQQVYYTTRRYTKLRTNSIYLDFNEGININFDPTRIYICVGIADVQACEKYPKKTWEVNVESTLNLIEKFHKMGSHINFLSSDMVFGEGQIFPKIDSKKYPSTEYGRQKSRVEEELLNYKTNLTIFRMSKVISIYNNLFSRWFYNLNNKKKIMPFSDYYLCPVSLKYVTQVICDNNKSGVIHLSGNKRISYADFAIKLADKMNVSKNYIKPITVFKNSTSKRSNKNVLDMDDTKKILGIKPQSLSSVINDLFTEFKNKRSDQYLYEN